MSNFTISVKIDTTEFMKGLNSVLKHLNRPVDLKTKIDTKKIINEFEETVEKIPPIVPQVDTTEAKDSLNNINT